MDPTSPRRPWHWCNEPVRGAAWNENRAAFPGEKNMVKPWWFGCCYHPLLGYPSFIEWGCQQLCINGRFSARPFTATRPGRNSVVQAEGLSLQRLSSSPAGIQSQTGATCWKKRFFMVSKLLVKSMELVSIFTFLKSGLLYGGDSLDVYPCLSIIVGWHSVARNLFTDSCFYLSSKGYQNDFL